MSEYPPFRHTVEQMPLHPDQGVGGLVYACRGGDSFDWRCPECVEEAERWVEAGMNYTSPIRFHEDEEQVGRDLAWLAARSRALFAEQSEAG